MKFSTSGTGVGVGDMVGVGVTVGVGETVGVGDRVGVGDTVGVGVAVGGGDRVGVGVAVGVGETVGVGDRVAVGVCSASRFSERFGKTPVGTGGPNSSVLFSLNTSAYRLEKEPGIISTKKETQVTANPSSVRCSLFISDKSSDKRSKILFLSYHILIGKKRLVFCEKQNFL